MWFMNPVTMELREIPWPRGGFYNKEYQVGPLASWLEAAVRVPRDMESTLTSVPVVVFLNRCSPAANKVLHVSWQ